MHPETRHKPEHPILQYLINIDSCLAYAIILHTPMGIKSEQALERERNRTLHPKRDGIGQLTPPLAIFSDYSEVSWVGC